MRTGLWRWFDFAWGLHILDPRGREDTHHPLLIASAALALLSAPSWPCAACPDALTWPQTKFLVKRVPDDEADASGVRRLIDGIAPAGRMSWSIGML